MGCRVCRARKVKCDGRPNGCRNCERLQLDCVDDNGMTTTLPLSLGNIRTYRSCTSCRASKTKCNGDRPRCSRCVSRKIECVYVGGSAPRWASSMDSASLARRKDSRSRKRRTSNDDESMGDVEASAYVGNDSAVAFDNVKRAIPPRTPQPATDPPSFMAPPPAEPDGQAFDLSGALSWLLSPELPHRRHLRSLAEQYFANVHPIRCFAFVHKPSFMRQLDSGFRMDDDMALLYIMCAHGAKFHALSIGHFGQAPSPGFLRTAGNQWADKSEAILLEGYGKISVPRLMALVLLHDFRLRLGHHSQALVLSGVAIRMAQALRLNTEFSPDLLCSEDESQDVEAPSAVSRESRRRLMWACYALDVCTMSGPDQFPLLRETDIKIQLPCNERNFGLRIPCVTETLGLGHVLQFLPPAAVPARPAENMGIMAYYVRIMTLRKKISQYVHSTPSGPGPWQPESEFAALDADMHNWRRTLPDFVEYSPDTIYARLDSNQLGGLMLIHCTYHHTYLELYKISMPELFSLRSGPPFPSEKTEVLQALQAECYFHARQVSRLVAEAAEHDMRLLSDSMLPFFLYDSSRIMLYYVGQLFHPDRVDATERVEEAVAAVAENARLLREMAPLFPTSEPFLATLEQWLSKVRHGSPESALGSAGLASVASSRGTERPSFSSAGSIRASSSDVSLPPIWGSRRPSHMYPASDRAPSTRPIISSSANSVGDDSTTKVPSHLTTPRLGSDSSCEHTSAAEQLVGLSRRPTLDASAAAWKEAPRPLSGVLKMEDLQLFPSWDIQGFLDVAEGGSRAGSGSGSGIDGIKIYSP